MNPIEIVHFIEELIRSEAKVIAFSVASIVVTLVVLYAIRKWILPQPDSVKLQAEIDRKDAEIARKDSKIQDGEYKLEDRDRKIAELKNQVDATESRYRSDRDAMKEQIDQLSKACESLKDEGIDLASKAETTRLQLEKAKADLDLLNRKAVTTVRGYKDKVAALTLQMEQVEKQDGRFWESPVKATIPLFRKLADKSAPIIAVTNLKGGVGKTTLTANLAATYWEMGKRVLIVDLDHQASLTFLCLSHQQIADIRHGAGRYVDNLLKARNNHSDIAWNNLARINDHDAHILAAREELTNVEDHIKAHWLLHQSEYDLRYVLRSALHHPSIQQRFDIILIDCPPRLTPASINALTCADYALIPVSLDRPSTEAVPRQLALMRQLKEKQICPNLEILGVVGNRAFRRSQLTTRETNAWENLKVGCDQNWPSGMYRFARFIPMSAQFAEAAANRTMAACCTDLEPIFTSLVIEIEERRAHYESHGTATVSA